MAYISMKQLLEAGVHFGHQTRRWNPKMKKYIFGARNGIYIIDLQKTVRMFDVAYRLIAKTVSEGKSVLFVGTKKQARDSIYEEANRCEMFFINNRWLGGILTNFQTIKKRTDRLNELTRMKADGSIKRFPKEEGDTIVYIVTYAFFVNEYFVTFSIADDEPDFQETTQVKSLLKGLTILTD